MAEEVGELHAPATPAARLRIVVVAELGNPVASSWIQGLSDAGAHVVVLDQREQQADPEDLAAWQVGPGTVVMPIGDLGSVRTTRDRVHSAFEGAPHIIFAWCGQQVLPAVAIARRAFPTVPIVLRIETLPNASTLVTEAREVLRMNRADPAIQGYAFYSPVMRAMFHQRVPGARRKPAIDMVEPFPLRAYASGHAPPGPRLQRVDGRPHLIYTGRSDLLWADDPRMARDRMGPFLERLSRAGISVTVKPDDGAAASRGLSTYPHFTNEALFDGRFATYMSDFDIQLVAYHEENATVRRRVRTSLSTRLAFAMTATTPLAVSAGSDFIRPLIRGRAFALMFSSAEDLAHQLQDRDRLASLRDAMASVNTSFAMEAQAPRMVRFMRHVMATSHMAQRR